MKYLALLMLVLAAIWVPAALADSPLERLGETIKTPIEIEGSSSPRFNVTFLHETHKGKGFGCAHCHHDRSEGSSFVSCRDENCHATPGPRERDIDSMFMAFHSSETDRSCYGCHTKLANENPEKYPSFKNCQPCHMSPQSRAAAK